MEALNEDVVHLNSQVLLLASDPDEGDHILRVLGAHPLVIQRIASAGSKAVGTAIRCGIPLVTFTHRLEEVLINPAAELQAGAARQVPATIRALARDALHMAQRLAFIDRTVAQLHFDFTPRACEGLVRLSVSRMTRLIERQGVLIKLRAAEQVTVWDRLLIGDRYDGPRGFRISQQAALLSLGND
jgi:hypothetical protein